MKRKILIILGTRPEAIKFAPLIKTLRHEEQSFDVAVCNTGQHLEMTNQVLEYFSIVPDYSLNVMRQGQTLTSLSQMLLGALDKVIDDFGPDLIFVQGDTTTTFIGALAGFYKQVKIAHLEAGLRSNDRFSPFPEEVNRTLTGHIADFHFAVTKRNELALHNENINNGIYVVGNTGIDTLHLCLDKVRSEEELYTKRYSFIEPDKRMILMTGHRRESFGQPFVDIFNAIGHIEDTFKDTQFIYPVHLNPNVRAKAFEMLEGKERIHLLEPVDYPDMLWLMSKSYFIVTDSGGIQEEAPSLGKPLIVTRDVTERVEGVDCGTALLAGTERNKLEELMTSLLTNDELYNKMSVAENPYGDGNTSQRIASILKENLF